jgi:homopolymeric O-antigen transport system permease protein
MNARRFAAAGDLKAAALNHRMEPIAPARDSDGPAGQVVRISAGRRPRMLDLRDLWAYRELLYFLAWRDVKVRYKQTALGAAWAILQPVASMLVFTLFFGKLARIPTDGIPYPIFVFAGLLPWTFFANAVTASGDSLVANSSLITKVYFPRVLIPGAAVAAGLVDFAIAAAVLLVMMPLYAVPVSLRLLMTVPLLALTVLIALAFGMWIAALNVRYRDARYAVPFLIQLWMFLTPVIYPVSIVPQRWRWLLYLNPMSGLIQGYRSALLDRAFDWTGILVAGSIALAMLAWSGYAFRQMERSFADIV